MYTRNGLSAVPGSLAYSIQSMSKNKPPVVSSREIKYTPSRIALAKQKAQIKSIEQPIQQVTVSRPSAPVFQKAATPPPAATPQVAPLENVKATPQLLQQVDRLVKAYKKSELSLAGYDVTGLSGAELDGLFSSITNAIKKVVSVPVDLAKKVVSTTGNVVQKVASSAVDVAKQVAPVVLPGIVGVSQFAAQNPLAAAGLVAAAAGMPQLLPMLQSGGAPAAQGSADYIQTRIAQGASSQQIADELARMQIAAVPVQQAQQPSVLNSLASVLSTILGPAAQPPAPPTYAQPTQAQPTQAPVAVYQTATQPAAQPQGLPSWVLPVSIGGGVLLLTFILTRRK